MDARTLRTLLYLGTLAASMCASLVHAATPVVTVANNGNSLGRYDVYEITMTHSGTYANPWEDIVIAAAFTSPTAKTYTAGGFYYDTNTWKLRFAPMETGNWTWTCSFNNGAGIFTANGAFTCTASSNTGFMRIHPGNPTRFMTEGNGRAFYPLGFNRGMPGPTSGLATLANSLFSTDSYNQGIPLNEYFKMHTAAGYNIFRTMNLGNGFHTLTFNGFNVNGTGKNNYDNKQCKMADELMVALHAAGMKCQMVFYAAPQGSMPGFDLSNAMVRQACLNLHKYTIDRFGAYMDIWELMNEQNAVPQNYLDTVTNYVKGYDPYRHLVTISYDQPQLNQSALDLSAPHVYQSIETLNLDYGVAYYIHYYQNQNANKPVLYGESGHGPPYSAYDPERYRIMIWTAFFTEGGLIFWNGGPKSLFWPGTGGIANQYIGEEERTLTNILTAFVSDFDASARPISFTVSPFVSNFWGGTPLRGYGLGNANEVGIYFLHSSEHDTLLSGATVTLNVPANNMQGEWLEPNTGRVLQTFTVNSGSRTLNLPSFKCDVVLRLRRAPATPLPVLQFEVPSYRIAESGGSLCMQVTRMGASAGAVSVDFATADGVAKAGSDYSAVSGTLTWADGDMAPKTIQVPILDDNALEIDRDFSVMLSNAAGGAVIGANSRALGAILNDDLNEVAFASPSYTLAENAGTVTIAVNRTGNGVGPASICVWTRPGGTAVAGADYVAISNAAPVTLNWSDGDMSLKTFTVTILNDTTAEGNKFFVVELFKPGPGTSSGAFYRAWITILDDDSPGAGVLQFTGYTSVTQVAFGTPCAYYSAAENAGSLSLAVQRIGGAKGAISVPYTVSTAGTAIAGSDFVAASGTLSWADNDSSNKALSISIGNDALHESHENIWITLGTPTGGATLGAPDNAIVRIWDDDNQPPVVNFTSPANNASFAANATIALAATASDIDGSIQKVEFYQGSICLGEACASPYAITWNNAPSGSYTLTAKATDDTGRTTASSPLNITVTIANQPPQMTSSPTAAPDPTRLK